MSEKKTIGQQVQDMINLWNNRRIDNKIDCLKHKIDKNDYERGVCHGVEISSECIIQQLKELIEQL